MREPFEIVWHMQDNIPTEGTIYFVESYIDHKENPNKDDELGFYRLTNKIKNVYYIISEYNKKHTSPLDLKSHAVIRHEDKIFNTRNELCKSLMED